MFCLLFCTFLRRRAGLPSPARRCTFGAQSWKSRIFRSPPPPLGGGGGGWPHMLLPPGPRKCPFALSESGNGFAERSRHQFLIKASPPKRGKVLFKCADTISDVLGLPPGGFPPPPFPPKRRLPGRLGTALGPPPQPRFPHRKGSRNPFFGPSYLGNPSVTDCQPKGSKRRASLARSLALARSLSAPVYLK